MHVTTLRAKKGKHVHATPMGSQGIGKTVCGKPCDGWVITDSPLDCVKCLRALLKARGGLPTSG